MSTGGDGSFARPRGAERVVPRTRFERSARFWLRAYPRRWRRERADEVLAVLAELASAADAGPGAAGGAPDRPIGPRAALDLVRHGWATRWRGHPPLLAWLAYHAWSRRLPVRYRAWAADEIDGALVELRRAWVQVTIVVGLTAWTGARWTGFALGGALVLVILVLPPVRRRRRRQERERHLVAEPGEPLVSGTYVAMGAPRRRVPTTWAVPRALVLDVAALGSAAVAAALAPDWFATAPVDGGYEVLVGTSGWGRWTVLGGLAAGLAASWLWNRRARRALAWAVADLPAQPERVVAPPGREADAGLATLVVAVVAWCVGEALGAWPVSLSVVAGLLAALHLPRALAIAAAARRAGHRAPDGTVLTWADLDKVAATRDLPALDTQVRVVRRWDGPTVPGQVVLGPRPPEPTGPEGDPFRLA